MGGERGQVAGKGPDFSRSRTRDGDVCRKGWRGVTRTKGHPAGDRDGGRHAMAQKIRRIENELNTNQVHRGITLVRTHPSTPNF